MNYETENSYIYQPLPAGENDGKIFRVVFKNKTRTPLLTKQDAEYVLMQQNKRSVTAAVKKALAI
jgi:hypothetical protein